MELISVMEKWNPGTISSFLKDNHIVCSYSRGYRTVREKRLGKQSYLAPSREDIREAHTILAYCFTDSLFSLLNRLVMSQREVVYRRFFRFWLNFPNRNYRSRSVEYRFNRCWHHTFHLKKKTFPIFKNLLKTSETATTVPGCLKIPLTSMRVVCIAPCKLWEHRPQVPDLVNCFPLPHPPDWFLNPLEETLLQFYFSFYSE